MVANRSHQRANSEKKHLFDEKLKDYETKLVDLYEQMGLLKIQNPKLSKIYAYLRIHHNLTQKQIRDLTGFSINTISSFLTILMNSGLLRKRMIPGTRTYEYIHQESINQTVDRQRTLFFEEVEKEVLDAFRQI